MNLPCKFIGKPPNCVSHTTTVHRIVVVLILIFVRQKVYRRLQTTT